MKSLLFLFCVSIGFYPVSSQIIYNSTSGHIIAAGVRNSQRVFLESHQSLVSLNYESMSVVIQVDLKTLDTGVDSLNRLLRRGTGKLVSFEGKAALHEINLSGHPQRSFDLIGYLTLNSVTKPLRFNATLSHLASSENNACLLSANAAIALRDFNLQLPGFSDRVTIEIVQVVLRKQSQ